MQFTPSQKLAAELAGDSLTVSAAAGSGKTAVLVARVTERLCDKSKRCGADRLLILTYTNAAAAQMRRRIANALRDKLAKNPENDYIRRQLSLLPAAKICTIHAACLDLIRQNFDKLGLDPQFSIAEETRLELMRSELTDEFIENLYERADNDESAEAVINYFSRGRDDSALYDALQSGCEFLQNEPYPEDFIELACHEKDSVFDLLPGRYIYKYIHKTLSDIILQYDALTVRAQSTGFEKLSEFYDNERTDIQHVLKSVTELDFNGAYAAVKIKLKNHPVRKKGTDETAWNSLKEERGRQKERFLKLCGDFLYADESTVLSDRKSELLIINQFFTLCLELENRLKEQRKRLKLVSFNDAEKYALKLLIESHSGKSIVKTKLAKELSSFYDEIIVDEFQDCSKIQDYLFRALSKDEKNIFTVGDVKQSIYRFRNAFPRLFIEKLEHASPPPAGAAKLTFPSRLNLEHNFRSHSKILNFVNRIFDTLMTKERGGVDYRSGHRLSNGGLYDKDAPASVTLSLLVSDGQEKQTALSRLEGEADFIARKIKEITGTLSFYDTEKNIQRTVTYGDIAILMRAPATTGAVIEKALEAAGIGCINNNPSEKYLDTPHVRDVLAYLQTIDNPYNDIPLITLMYSDYFGFTVNELGKIRARNKDMPFFDAVKNYAQNDDKTKNFVQTLNNLRQKSTVTDVYGLLNIIYEQSGILLRVLSEPDGEAARANLMLLLDFAAQFESLRYRGLFSFINYVLKLIERDQTVPAARLRKSDSCVHLLSIHRSKGLEFPVVFLVTAGNDITINISGDILADSDLGAGAYLRDSVKHRDFSTLCRAAIKEKMKEDEIYEYIRLLYVALTRAKSHLFISAAMNAADAEKTILRAAESGGNPSDCDICDKKNFFAWILYAVMGCADAAPFAAFAGAAQEPSADAGLFNSEISVLCGQSDENIQESTEKTNDDAVFSYEYIKEMITRKYAFEKSTRIPSKLSVSEIKNMQTAGTEVKISVPKPRFLQNGVTGADRGNATHRFLQFCDFDSVTDMSSLEREAKRLTENEFISKRDGELIEKEKILRFLQSDTMRRLNTLGTCNKEQRFLFTLPAKKVMDTDSEEPIIIQGVIDCWYIENGKAVIVDYKTDSVKDAAELVRRYEVQLKMYEKALSVLNGITTAHKYIYSFALSEFIEV